MKTDSFYRSRFTVHIEEYSEDVMPCVLSYMNFITSDVEKIYQHAKERFKAAPGFIGNYRKRPCASVFKTANDAANVMQLLIKEGYRRYEFQMFYD